MNKIIFPLKLRMKGPKVADLQDALQLLLDRGIILQDDESARRYLSAALQRERAGQTYGKVTNKLVGIFQEARRIESSGAVENVNLFLRGHLESDKYQKLTDAEGRAAFLTTSYLFGHLLFLMGSWLDEVPYDWLRRRYTLNKQIVRLARRGRLLPWCARALIWTVFKQERDLAVDRAGKIKEPMLKGLHARNAVNTFQWSKAFVALEYPEGLATVQRFERRLQVLPVVRDRVDRAGCHVDVAKSVAAGFP